MSYVVHIPDDEGVTVDLERHTLISAIHTAGNLLLARNTASVVLDHRGTELFRLDEVETYKMALKKKSEVKKTLGKKSLPNSDAKERFHNLEEASKTKGFVATKKERAGRKDAYKFLTTREVKNPKIVKTKWSSFRIVQPEDAGVNLDPIVSIPQTYVVLEGNMASHMVTIMPDDLRIAWSKCARCSWSVFVCKCVAGSKPSRSIEYIYDQVIAKSGGEDWGPQHPNYRSAVRHEERRKIVEKERRSKRVFEVGTATPKKGLRKASAVVAESPRKPLRKAGATEVPPQPKKSLRKSSSTLVADVARGDFKSTDLAAAEVAEEAVKKMLKTSGKKSLRKRS